MTGSLLQLAGRLPYHKPKEMLLPQWKSGLNLIKKQNKWEFLVPASLSFGQLLQDLLNVFVCYFHCLVHFGL